MGTNVIKSNGIHSRITGLSASVTLLIGIISRKDYTDHDWRDIAFMGAIE